MTGADSRRRKLFKIAGTVFAVVFLAAAAVIGYYAVLGYKMHSAAMAAFPPSQMAAAYEKDNFVTIGELPEYYVKAVICTEDRRFYSHCGVDPQSVLRALWYDIRTLSFDQGGSTITQQLAKNVYYNQEKRLERKFAECFTALKIEKELSKDRIFELYVNTIYFGSGYYGIYDAALGYYGKTPPELGEGECAMLAGIPNAPSVYSPDADPVLARERMEQVLECIAGCEAEK